MITFSKLGRHGNLGNQLFEIASTIGIARSNKTDFVFPEWEPSKYFKKKIPTKRFAEAELKAMSLVQEGQYHYMPLTVDRSSEIDLLGWLQTKKYWMDFENEVKDYFKFKNEFKDLVLRKQAAPFDSMLPVCAISVRRGDYVGNRNYHQLTIDYYLGAAKKMIELCSDLTFLVFSDDIAWCKKNFPASIGEGCVYFTELIHPVEQLAQMTLCKHFVIANSTFSWWGAYLGEDCKTRVIAPAHWNAGELLKTSDDKDVVPERWIKFEPDRDQLPGVNNNRYDLRDVTFTIPVKRDSQDRVENLELSVQWLNYFFDTNIIVGEMDEVMHLSYIGKDCEYRFWKGDKLFKRTWMLNQMAREAKTPIVVNWDCDVFVSPEQLVEAVKQVREQKLDGCYPYDGRFFRVPRNNYIQIKATLQVSDFHHLQFPKYQYEVTSYGGAVVWNKKKFFEGGGENENFVDYGPEDYERYHRFKTLGFKIGRVNGPLYHLDHDETKNGSKGHAKHQFNHIEYERIKRLGSSEIRNEMRGWGWLSSFQFNNNNLLEEVAAHPLRDLLQVDAIYLINLKSRTDKLEHAKEQLALIGLEGVVIYPAIDGYALQLKSSVRQLSPGMLGCYYTHKKIITEALERGLNTIVIMEDDVEFIGGFNELMRLAMPEVPEDWEFLYLGAKEYGGLLDFKEKVNEHWVIPKGVWGTQAYAIRGRKAMMKILNHLELMKMQLDNQYCKEVLPNSGVKYYMLFPSAVDQWRHESSDVQVANPEVLNFS